MGIASNVGFSEFPAQGHYVGRRVKVCFHYDTSNQLLGTVVRCDAEEPGIMIIRLDDGRHLLSTECMYSPIREGQP